MITAEALTKQRGGRAVVSDVTFRCEPGTVTGFLGPNGAGKTTTMRMLVGLSAPDSGQALLFGGRHRDLPNPGRRVGILLDAFAQHAGRRGREALAVSAQTMGVPAHHVDTLLELADRGGTVLLSSHLLAEVEAIADRMMIIGNGRIQAQGTRAELLTESGTIVEADDLAELDAALHSAGLATHAVDGDRRLVEAEPEDVARLAMANDIVLRRLAPAGNAGLERLFFELTTAGANAPSPKTDPIPLELAGATA
jgi:ABC-2 type transport system ATP-binding protein